jgi:hypothetical protein
LVEDLSVTIFDFGPEVVVVVLVELVIAVVQGGCFGYGTRSQFILEKV